MRKKKIKINLISTTISLIAYIFVLILNNGFNGEGALYICCGLAIFFNYLNIDWIYQGLEEYGSDEEWRHHTQFADECYSSILWG